MFFKKRKEEKTANNAVKDMITHKALKELKIKDFEIEELNKGITIALENAEELRKDKKNLERNLEVLQASIENIREICNNSKGKVVSKKKILKELGE